MSWLRGGVTCTNSYLRALAVCLMAAGCFAQKQSLAWLLRRCSGSSIPMLHQLCRSILDPHRTSLCSFCGPVHSCTATHAILHALCPCCCISQ